MSELESEGAFDFCGLLSVIKEILNHRSSNDSDHEAVRSTIISASSGPQVELKKLAHILSL